MAIADWIEKWAAQCPDKIAIRYENETITYGDFHQHIIDMTIHLHETLKLRRGDRIAYLGQNHPRILYLIFACARLGAVFVPLNWRLTAHEHFHMLSNCTPSALFVDDPYLDQSEILCEKFIACQFVNVGTKKRTHWLTLGDRPSSVKITDIPKNGMPNDPLFIIFTSGTTGFPKGAVLTQKAVEVNALHSIDMHDMTSDDIALIFLPMFHVGGLNVMTLAVFSLGGTVLLHQNFDVEKTINAMNKQKPSLVIILPAHMTPLMGHKKWKDVNLSSLKAVSTGSCAIPIGMTRYWHDQNIPLLQVYGSSETSPIAIHQKSENAFETEGSIGFPAKYCTVKIVDEMGKDCATGEAGEILIKGDNVMVCYWNDAEGTEAVLKEGWYHTGDIGYQDEGGCYHFVDRKKDMIISGGENIYPAELEMIMGNHPNIQDVSVVGKADDRWGEIVVAFIVTQKGKSLSKEDVLEWLKDKLGRYKHPRLIHFIDEMPRNEMRKILKEKLKLLA
ncbi:MAG: AMP-binding protein [Emcibacter sp.]|nr:AMP-binding protein [Emcibacter sp.]